METQSACCLCIWVLFIQLMMCPERGTTSFLLDIEVKSKDVHIRLSDNVLKTFKKCTCMSQTPCTPLVETLSDNVNTNSGYTIVQFRKEESGSLYTYFSCKYVYNPRYDTWVECHRKQSDDYICTNYTTCNVTLSLKCPDNSNVFITWDPTQEALVHDYNTTEINLVQCCASTSTEKPNTTNLDTPAATGDRPETDNAAKMATTTTKSSASTSRTKSATTTTKFEADSNPVTASNIPTTTDNNTTNQNQQEQHTEEVAEFSPAYFGLLIGVCVASATISVLITSFVMIKWHQRQDKSSHEPKCRYHQERQNETAFANNIANHRDGNAIEMTETNTSHVANAQGTSERSPGQGHIPNNNNLSSASLQYSVSGNYTEVDAPSTGPAKVARNDVYTEVKKASVKNPADTNNFNITEDSTYSRLHATRRDMQNLYDILPHEGDDGHGGINSPYSEVAVPKPETVLSIL